MESRGNKKKGGGCGDGGACCCRTALKCDRFGLALLTFGILFIVQWWESGMCTHILNVSGWGWRRRGSCCCLQKPLERDGLFMEGRQETVESSRVEPRPLINSLNESNAFWLSLRVGEETVIDSLTPPTDRPTAHPQNQFIYLRPWNTNHLTFPQMPSTRWSLLAHVLMT